MKRGDKKIELDDLEILALVPKSGKISVPDLTVECARKGLVNTEVLFNSQKKEVERILKRLNSNGFVLSDHDKKTKPIGWWRTERADQLLTIPDMTAAQALSVHLAQKHLKPLLPSELLPQLTPFFDEAKNKLTGHYSARKAAAWLDRVRVVSPGMPMRPPVVSHQVREAMTTALMDGKQVEFEYAHYDKRPTKPQRGHPLGLVQNGVVQYIVMRFFEYPNAVLTAMHRFKNVKVLSDAIQMPPNFSLDDYLKSGVMGFGYDGKSLKLVADFKPWAARHLLESPLSDDQTVVIRGRGEEERLRVSATVQNTDVLRRWLLSFGDQVTVIGPAALRKAIAQTLADAAQRYAKK